MKVHFIIALFLTLLSSSSLGQGYQFRNITVEDGLPSSEVYHAYQDRSGYIWFATNMGVCRYDGYAFQNFDLEDGLPDNTIFEIYQDYKDRIWFISFSLKLSYFKDGKIHEYKYNDSIQSFLKAPYIQNKKAFALDKEDNIYIGINKLGVIKIDSVGKITQIDQNYPKALYILKKSGRYITARTKTKIKSDILVLHHNNSADTIPFKTSTNNWQNNIFIEELENNNLLISKEGELFEVSENKITQNYDLKDRVIWMSKSNNKHFWLGSYNGALYFQDEDISKIKEHILKNYPISSVLIDHEEGYWFTTLSNGVFYLPSLNFPLVSKEELNNSSLQKISIDSCNNIWITNNDNMIWKLNSELEIISKFQLPKDIKLKEIRAINYIEHLDEVWISNGYKIKNGKIKKLELYNDLEIISPKEIIGVNSSGFFRIINNKTTYRSWAERPFTRLSAISKTKQGIFLGGLNGLYLLEGNNIKSLGEIDKRLKYRITDIKQYEKFLLLATRGGGILIFDPEKKIVKQITKKDNLISNNIKRFELHENYIFAATNNGISRIEVTNLEKNYFNIDNFSTYSGLPGLEVNDIEIKNNIIYIATNNGLSFCNINHLNINKIPPRIHLRNINISGKDTTLQQNYILPYDKNFIKIKFTGLSYKNIGNLLYRYKMEGLDGWKYTTSTEKMYTTLPPGKYTFNVLVQNENGIWSKEKASVSFTIKKPYWETLWFISLLIIIGIAGVYLIFYFRFRMIRRKNQLLQDINNYKQIVLRQQMNPHFLFNTLNSIQYYLLENDTNASLTYLSKFARLMRMILENSQFTYISIHSELEALKLYLELEQIRLDNNFEYQVEAKGNIDLEENKIPSLLLQPYAENSIHHGLRYKQSGKGRIDIFIERENDMIKFTIQDNGVGRKKAEKIKQEKNVHKKPLGSKITENRIKTLNALNIKKIDIYYEDMADLEHNTLGTRVVIKIPSRIQNG